MANVQIGPNPTAMASGREYKLDLDHVIFRTVVLISSARDENNAPTTTLRKGLVLGRITASGLYMQYDNSASDGNEVARGILDRDVDLRDENGDVQNAVATMLIHGYVDETYLIGIDQAGANDMLRSEDIHTAAIIIDDDVT